MDVPGSRGFLSALSGRRYDQLSLLEVLVGIDSQWSNPIGVERKADLLCGLLSEAGFVTRAIPQPAVSDDLRWAFELLAPGVVTEELASTRHAVRPGRGRATDDPPVLLLGDVDTAFRGGPTGESPFRTRGDEVLGTGVADMQGGLVVLLEAIRVLDRFSEDCPPLEIVLAGDEQAGSPGSRHVIADAAGRCPVTLCLECARDGGNLMRSRAHIGVGILEVIGRESHTGSGREDGSSAIRGICGVLPAVDDLSHGGRLATVTMLSAGRRRSVVPGRAAAVIDLRARDAAVWDGLVGDLEALALGVGGGLVASVRTNAHRPGVPTTPSILAVIRLAQDFARSLGIDVPGAVTSDAAGSSAFAAAWSTVVDGMGPPGGSLMTPDEHVSSTGIGERAALLAGVILRTSGFGVTEGPRAT